MSTAAVVLAGGSGTRVGADRNKVLLHVAGEPLLAHSVRTVLQVDDVHRIVLVCRAQDREAVAEAVTPHLGAHDVWLVEGGATRHDSEIAALEALREDVEGGDVDVVAIHDGARPLAPPSVWTRVIAAAREHGGAIPVVGAGRLSRRDGSLGPPGLVAVQTPQAFRARPLLASYDAAEREHFRSTDTAGCLERYADPPLRLVAVPSSPTNLKVTFPGDLATADALARGTAP